MNPSTVRTVFRTVAIAEAVSWAGLLIAMFLKWVVQADPHTGAEGGVPIMGPIHGGVFVIFVITCLVASRTFVWTAKTTLLALASSVPPFCSVLFEVKADARGLLQAPTAQAGATSAP